MSLLTASEALALSNSTKTTTSNTIPSQLDNIAKKISKAANNTKVSIKCVEVRGELNESTITTLESNGYTVTTTENYQLTITCVSWE